MTVKSPTSLPSPKEWIILATVALVQLIVVLDGTIVAIALPQAQIDLGLTNAARSWAITSYALAFGSLLLLGGLLVARWGMKQAMMVGLIGFAVSSALGGVVQDGGQLIAARALQGVFAALMAPAALAILTTVFSGGRSRTIAFAVFGTCAGVGAAIGLLLGGLLTEFFSWRWTLLINVPVVILILAMGLFALPRSSATKSGSIDLAGLALVIPGLGALVYGLTLAEHGWLSVDVFIYLGLALLLLATFVLVESKVRTPLLPLNIVADRVRGTAMLIQVVAGALMIGTMLFVAFHLQLVLGMPPFLAGLATVPQTLSILAVVAMSVRYLDRFGPKPFLVTGLFVAGAAFTFLAMVDAEGSYWNQVLPALIASGIGMGLIYMPLQNVALSGVKPEDAGAAGAVVNAAGQIGGSVGLAVFTSVATLSAAGGTSVADLAQSYAAVFSASAILLFGMGLIAVLLLPNGFKPAIVPGGPALGH